MAYDTIKRVIDIIGGIILSIIFFPVCMCTAIAIKLNSQGPIFADTPQRVGKNGKLFKLYKFRSMIMNAHKMLRKDPKMARLYQQYRLNSYKLMYDPRVTSVGHIIRKHSIDEIPQLLNVLKGDMSLVGPRPYYQDELKEQQKKYPHTKKLVKVVLSAKPGVTGFWQVSGRSEVNFDKRIQMDADYVTKRSLLFDILILLKSPWAMISGKGAV
ncbi:MAG: Undecaprenyl-phosphate galactose phosphotransferase [Candidatus Gottesmanbacteria bacterium GW2011_GWA2_44_17]|uniref:Undecaprenyl-phosphate galactose phosphotransferase n=3 Tax=Candidatus Gottesmaniibacteriota TaxID=1752720 RepID=A0A0G1IMJ9_9BACT|nr:MAG: Undecaprenyl-phosphate galactose phosphotransferase [Microgenomates group bacterium GW2011_GWC1_43_11]KKT38742.1 MAG: Undecaprenyl-phosphate galactose phosphotransferase [Candidatus Gottesmanbacteria bacterium GW2011_GWB1_44_11c]KKT47124.1 MAG: Undecaprenyl-phosphate galactose phosphotransferase [Candidatus Gottesmanbacteria bacterium GW2011_GWA2_44_17]KKT60616.1 MAG: Undecaprenyl-phosphate galactose phosphotransferase [Candidatus Gottesmanbacteria bacterium GW2011_GWA1_44_24b]HCM82874.